MMARMAGVAVERCLELMDVGDIGDRCPRTRARVTDPGNRFRQMTVRQSNFSKRFATKSRATGATRYGAEARRRGPTGSGCIDSLITITPGCASTLVSEARSSALAVHAGVCAGAGSNLRPYRDYTGLGANAHRRRRRRHGAAEPLRRGVQTARWRPPRRRLDRLGPATGRSRACDPARPDPPQHLQLAAVGRGHARVPGRALDLSRLIGTRSQQGPARGDWAII